MNTRNVIRTSIVGGTLAILAVSVHAQHPLNSWTRRVVPGLTTNLSSVAFGNGVFVAVGAGSTVATSPDGINWTLSNAGAYGNLARVRFINGQFAAVGTSDKILFSTDGSSWTPNTLPSADSYDVAYGNGVYVTVGPTTYVSSDGETWTASGGLRDSVTFGNGLFVALPPGGGFPIPPLSYYSTNGVDWVAGAPGDFGAAIAKGEVIFSGGVFVGKTASRSLVFASTNGATWCCAFDANVQVGNPGVNGGLAHGQGFFLWAGYSVPNIHDGFPVIASSTNGMTWETRYVSSPFPPSNNPALIGNPRGAAFGNGTFVFVGDGGYIIQSGNLGGQPQITAQPQDRAAVVGNPASFSVQASGSQPLEYQWFFNSAAIPAATNASHTIPQVQTSDGGGYHVVITNSFGSVTSRVAQLGVAFLSINCYAGITVLGVPGRTYRIEATPATGPLNWQVLTNLVLPSSPYIWIDYDSPQFGQRLYRAAELPP